MAKANPFRFSSKYQDDETDLLYYGYRYRIAGAGAWISRDPLGEESGGPNVYGFVQGDPVNFTDPFGLKKCGVESFIVKWSAAAPNVNIGAIFSIEVSIKFKSGGDYDQRCCEFKQNKMLKVKWTHAGKQMQHIESSMTDDLYNRTDDMDGNGSPSSGSFHIIDNPGFTLIGVSEGDVISAR
jgi:RHS repeat-associated protein